jgi:hypothetical protein
MNVHFPNDVEHKFVKQKMEFNYENCGIWVIHIQKKLENMVIQFHYPSHFSDIHGQRLKFKFILWKILPTIWENR